MNRILMTTATAVAFMFTVPAGAQTTAPAPVTDMAPAVPQTAIGVQERRRLLTSDDATAAPAGMLIDDSGRYYADCSDPGITCENMPGMESTGTVNTLGDTAPAAPNTAIGVQQRGQLITSPSERGTPMPKQ